MSSSRYAVAIIGGGIVGLAVARELCRSHRVSVVVLEAEEALASHQTGHNSGVIHSGLYYRPGSRKATQCAAGRDALYRYCERHGIAHERCGKVVVATGANQVPILDELEARGRANGLYGLRRLGRDELREREPHAAGVAALLVPQTGIVHYPAVAERMAADLREDGGEIRLGARVLAVISRPGGFAIKTPSGEFEARAIVNCAGLQSDRVARLCGVRPGVSILPFRGEYYKLVPTREHLVRHLIYPVPDPRFPFLGVHFTRMIRGGIEAGPNAVLALKREGYGRVSFSLRDVAVIAADLGFWRLASRYWRTGLSEVRRSFSKSAFVGALRALVPEITSRDVVRHGSGVRAQAVDARGRLIDDFHIVEAPRQLHVLNAPSPAATASLAIGEALCARAAAILDLIPCES